MAKIELVKQPSIVVAQGRAGHTQRHTFSACAQGDRYPQKYSLDIFVPHPAPIDYKMPLAKNLCAWGATQGITCRLLDADGAGVNGETLTFDVISAPSWLDFGGSPRVTTKTAVTSTQKWDLDGINIQQVDVGDRKTATVAGVAKMPLVPTWDYRTNGIATPGIFDVVVRITYAGKSVDAAYRFYYPRNPDQNVFTRIWEYNTYSALNDASHRKTTGTLTQHSFRTDAQDWSPKGSVPFTVTVTEGYIAGTDGIVLPEIDLTIRQTYTGVTNAYVPKTEEYNTYPSNNSGGQIGSYRTMGAIRYMLKTAGYETPMTLHFEATADGVTLTKDIFYSVE